jgi:hypothetical protein
MFGAPLPPVRGIHLVDWDFWFTMVPVWLFVVLTFFVLDATYLNTRFIEYLARDRHALAAGLPTRTSSG